MGLLSDEKGCFSLSFKAGSNNQQSKLKSSWLSTPRFQCWREKGPLDPHHDKKTHNITMSVCQTATYNNIHTTSCIRGTHLLLFPPKSHWKRRLGFFNECHDFVGMVCGINSARYHAKEKHSWSATNPTTGSRLIALRRVSWHNTLSVILDNSTRYNQQNIQC